MSTEERANEIVRLFEKLLNDGGLPIRFETSLDRQREAAEELLTACGGDMAQVRAALVAYCSDKWWAWHCPELSKVVQRLDQLKAMQVPDMPLTWADL